MNTEFSIPLIEEIENAWPLARWDEFHVVVAVSGGADSVALLRALVEVKKRSRLDSEQLSPDQSGSLIVAHFNHQLRGAESDGDAKFVEQLADQFDLEFHSGVADESEEAESESDLRDQRYRFLVDVARQTNSRYIVTAHHRDDQIETVLFRLFRGTGLNGLRGIPFSRVVDESLTIVRPMRDAQKNWIEQALAVWNQPWREDVTNAQSNYTRNFLRNEILPVLRDRFPDVDGSIARLSTQAAEQSGFLSEQTQSLLDAATSTDASVVLDCQELSGQSPVLIRELFAEVFRDQAWPTSQLGFAELDRLAKLVLHDADQPLFQLPGGVNCEKRDGEIRLWEKKTQQPE